jgi:acetyl esterase
MVQAFLPNEADRKLPINSPLNSMSDAALAKFPPTIIFCAGVDPLRQESEEFGHRLQQLGVDAAVLRVDGQVHDFAIIGATRVSPGSQAAISLAALKVKSALF